MFMFVIAVLLFLIAVPLILLGTKTYEGDYDTFTIPLRIIGVVLAGFAGFLVLISCMYTQDPGEAVVIRGPGGDVVDVDTSAGFGFTAPWNKRVEFDIRNQKIEMFSNTDGNGDDGAAISAPVKEGTDVKVSITVPYSIRGECVEDIYTQYKNQGNLLDRALKPAVRDEVRKATSEFSVFQIKQSRGELTTSIVERLTDRWDDLCVTVENVDLGDMNLDETTETSLQSVIDRQLEVERSRADLERAQIEAEVVKTQAQAQQAADQIIRCGATVTTEEREIGGVSTPVNIVTPVPVESCQNLLNEQVLINNYIEALREIGAEGNLVVVSDDVNSILNVPAGATPGG